MDCLVKVRIWLYGCKRMNFLGYQNSFDGSFKIYTSSIVNYQMVQLGNIRYPIYNIAGMHVNGSMMILASLQLKSELG
ncbi:transmembrane protein, putative [Medicago truncatula]|uniref:Transmembrane protein, putative n=1 Tax=Medicago truncatula TaxID=3880 RepID=G7K4W4_MEDTR|nr:transmembrane protein, putative [Medicago truncatula]